MYPRTGLRMTQNDMNMLCAKSKSNAHNYIRNILLHFLTEEEIYAFGSAEKVNKGNPMIRLATLGMYMPSNIFC